MSADFRSEEAIGSQVSSTRLSARVITSGFNALPVSCFNCSLRIFAAAALSALICCVMATCAASNCFNNSRRSTRNRLLTIRCVVA